MKLKIPNISVEITSECNLNCKYCYNHWRPQENREILNSYKKAKKVIKQLLKQVDVETITFTGGEPFISERFEEILLFTRLKKKKVNVITNGQSISDEVIESIVKMGIQLFELPFHSMYPVIHDSMTGKNGSWKKSMDSIHRLVNRGGYVVPVIILTKLNSYHIEETLEALSKLKLNRIVINRFNIGGNGIKHSNELLLSSEELNETFTKINTCATELGLDISSNVCTPFCLLNPLDFANIEFSSCPTNILQRPLTIDLNGDLRICNHSPKCIGNIFKTDIEKLLSETYVKSWEIIKPEYCSNCEKFEECLGGCRAASEQLGKGLHHVDPILEYKN
ncbi:radical SAM/SPASM domain-containing protein [Carboxylicivirga sp. N1Y90]|uniref:radical SAM protein n=1 Tax=Carboxylicivirga fragile TaxID=3417571 RepID=UPI003D32CEB8|nr:radical SAM protein [Marinilabiliaceae bacterium N1Y90]